MGDFPNGMADSEVGCLELLVVTEVGTRKNKGKTPDEANGSETIPGGP